MYNLLMLNPAVRTNKHTERTQINCVADGTDWFGRRPEETANRTFCLKYKGYIIVTVNTTQLWHDIHNLHNRIQRSSKKKKMAAEPLSQIRPQSVPSTSLSIHYSLMIPIFNVIESEKRYRRQINKKYNLNVCFNGLNQSERRHKNSQQNVTCRATGLDSMLKIWISAPCRKSNPVSSLVRTVVFLFLRVRNRGSWEGERPMNMQHRLVAANFTESMHKLNPLQRGTHRKMCRAK